MVEINSDDYHHFVIKDGKLFVSKNFPPLDSNFVGKDTIPNSNAIIKWFKDYFIPLKTIWLEDIISRGNDNWFIGIFLRRKES